MVSLSLNYCHTDISGPWNSPALFSILLSMLLVSRSTDVWKITCISSLCSIHKLFFPSISIFSFQYLLLFLKFFFHFLSLPSSVLQWNHEGGDFFSEYDQSTIQKCPLLSYTLKNLLIITFSDHFIFSILLQHHIS